MKKEVVMEAHSLINIIVRLVTEKGWKAEVGESEEIRFSPPQSERMSFGPFGAINYAAHVVGDEKTAIEATTACALNPDKIVSTIERVASMQSRRRPYSSEESALHDQLVALLPSGQKESQPLLAA